MDVVLDRKELYREVWSMTVSAVARKYNLTGYEIRKACFALDVPTPIQGYWAKVKAGDAPPVPPLPRKSGASTYTCTTTSRAPKTGNKQSRPKKPAKEKESIVDWVLRESHEKLTRQEITPAGKSAPESLKPPPDPIPPPRSRKTTTSAAGPRYLPLVAWAEQMFGEHAPHTNTLMRWARDGHISPAPRKMGRQWFVKADAEYVE